MGTAQHKMRFSSAFVVLTVALFLAIESVAHAQPGDTFFGSRGRARCAALNAWAADISVAARGRVEDRQVQELWRMGVPTFQARMGKRFADLSKKDREAIANGLKDCSKEFWIRQLGHPFTIDPAVGDGRVLAELFARYERRTEPQTASGAVSAGPLPGSSPTTAQSAQQRTPGSRLIADTPDLVLFERACARSIAGSNAVDVVFKLQDPVFRFSPENPGYRFLVEQKIIPLVERHCPYDAPIALATFIADVFLDQAFQDSPRSPGVGNDKALNEVVVDVRALTYRGPTGFKSLAEVRESRRAAVARTAPPPTSGQLPETAATSSPSLDRLLDAAARAQIPLKEITKAVLQGQLLPPLAELVAARNALPGASRGARDATWNARFGRIGDVGDVVTTVFGETRRMTGRDLLLRYVIYMQSSTGCSPVDRNRDSNIYCRLRDARIVDYESGLANADPDDRKKIDQQIEQLNQTFSVVTYFDNLAYEHVYRPTGDYEHMRLATRSYSLDEDRDPAHWSYLHGQGFRISAGLRALEDRARSIVSNASLAERLDSGVEIVFNTVVPCCRDGQPMDYANALFFLLRAARRDDATGVLGLVSDWTASRLVPARTFAGFQHERLLTDVFAGRFESWLGVPPSGPSGLSARARGWDLDVAFIAYQLAYQSECRHDTSTTWHAITVTNELVTKRGFQEISRYTTSEQKYEVRSPFAKPVLERLRDAREGARNQPVAGNSSPAITSVAAKADFVQLLKSVGCDSDPRRQMELNLYLIAEGFPPLQDLLANQGVIHGR